MPQTDSMTPLRESWPADQEQLKRALLWYIQFYSDVTTHWEQEQKPQE